MAYIKKLVKSQALRTFQSILNAAQNTFCSASRAIIGCRTPGKDCRYHTKGTGSRAIVVFGTSIMIKGSSTALQVQGFEYQQDSKDYLLVSSDLTLQRNHVRGLQRAMFPQAAEQRYFLLGLLKLWLLDQSV